MISTEIAVLAYSMRVVRPINVGTLVGWLFPASSVVAVLAHSLCVKLQVGVRTRGNEFLDPWISLFILQLALMIDQENLNQLDQLISKDILNT